MQSAKWRTAQEKDWDIKSYDKTKNKKKFITSSEFIGLENLG